MVSLSKQNILDHLSMVKECYVKSSGSVKETLETLAQSGFSVSKTSFYRLLKETPFFELPEIVAFTKRTENFETFLREIQSETKTIDELLELFNAKFTSENFNQWDMYSILSRTGLKYKKKDLSKKVYIQSKRVESKYAQQIDAIKKVIASGVDATDSSALAKSLFNMGMSVKGRPYSIQLIRQLVLYMNKERTPRGLVEIEQFVIGCGYKLVSLVDEKENDLSVKGKVLDVVCSEGHSKRVTLSRFVQNQSCKECVKCKKRQESEDKIRQYVSQYGVTDVNAEIIRNKFSGTCKKGHEFYSRLSNFRKNNQCPECYREAHGFSLAENEVCDYIRSLYSGEIVVRTRKVIGPHEIDIHLPEVKLAFEYDGFYYHSYNPTKAVKDPRAKFKTEAPSITYHRMKMDACVQVGVRLVHIFEDEWVFKKDICKSKIKSLLGLSEKIYARKLELVELSKDQSKDFMEQNHLQGSARGRKVAFGLVGENNKIYCCMTLSSPARSHTSESTIEIGRFASTLGFNVVGGFSRLLRVAIQWAKKEGYRKIRTHCDLRWGTGNVYAQTGFVKVYESKSTPHYLMRLRRYNSQSLRKTKEERLTGKTEKMLRFEQGYSIIYDCGHSTWEIGVY